MTDARPKNVTVNLNSATSALRDLATLNESGSQVWVTAALRKLADRYEEMAREQQTKVEEMLKRYEKAPDA